jgi:hypothetical protein
MKNMKSEIQKFEQGKFHLKSNTLRASGRQFFFTWEAVKAANLMGFKINFVISMLHVLCNRHFITFERKFFVFLVSLKLQSIFNAK